MRTMAASLFSLLVMLAACSCPPARGTTPKSPCEPGSQPASQPVDPPPAGPVPEANNGPPVQASPGQGSPCGPGDSCAAGLTCKKYFGVAGPRGGEFKTCEIPCTGPKDRSCPAGQMCVTVADGPGTVCQAK